jgi:hypothetical protein
MDQNPWAVESIQAFYILKCPDCDFNTKEEKMFENHTTENHPLSLVLFDKQSVKKDFDTVKIKEEPFSHFDTQISHIDKNSLTNNQFFPSCYINEDTSMLVVQDLKKELADVDENDFNNSSEMDSTEDFDKIDIKEEPLSQYDTEIVYHDNEKSSTLNQFPEFKKEPTDGTYVDENNFRDKENGINDGEMENCSTDIANIGVNLEGDPQSSKIMTVHEGKKQCKSGEKVIRDFKCNFCDYETSKNGVLKKHIESVHEGIKPFKCKLCDYKSALKGNLKTHIRSVHERIKPFKCNICDYRTDEQPKLTLHTNTVHDGIKPFKCHICEYESAQKGNLKKHIETVHYGLKPFKCNECDYQAAQKVNLNNHIKSVHITNIGKFFIMSMEFNKNISD